MLWVDKFSSSLVRKKLEAKDQDISSSLWWRPKTEQKKQKTKQPSQQDKISAANISQQTTETCHVDHLQRFLCINLTRARHRVVTEKVDIYVVVVIQHRNINTALKSWKKKWNISAGSCVLYGQSLIILRAELSFCFQTSCRNDSFSLLYKPLSLRLLHLPCSHLAVNCRGTDSTIVGRMNEEQSSSQLLVGTLFYFL